MRYLAIVAMFWLTWTTPSILSAHHYSQGTVVAAVASGLLVIVGLFWHKERE